MNKFAKWLGGAAAVALALGTLPAEAQTPIKFTLDWVFQGPTAPFLVALEKGYYKAEGLDVTMDPGQGSAGAVQRVATGAYQIGFADVNSTIEYNAKNPGKEVLCVFMAYDFAPFGVYALKKSGIKGPKDLEDNKLGIAAAKKRDPLIDEALETERLQISLQTNILTPFVKANGMGDVDPERFARSVKLVADAFGLPAAPAPDKVFTNKYLPPKADRMVAK